MRECGFECNYVSYTTDISTYTMVMDVERGKEVHDEAVTNGFGSERDADLLKDKSGPELPPEFQRSWCVEGHVRVGPGLTPRGPERAKNRSDPREAQRNMGVYTPYTRKDDFTPLTKTPKEILSMESISFLEPPPLIRTPKKQNLNKFCDYHREKGYNTNDYYQLRKQIKEAVASRELAYLVKDICQNNQRNRTAGRNGVKVINMIRQEVKRKRSFEEKRSEEVHQKSCMNIALETSVSTSGQDSEDAGFR
uniref:Reverse transcriptase domain-containing protein n=1 Tax=Tanacetum cinerariifolium TaxID=118510 RepID=A0A6L2LV67_TANCI|nr:reverse transcriptase domain-containing protein [Tanacetum cinerariifolium]